MRDLNRIYRYCHELADIWSKVPDWRFGQFILNMERACRMNEGKDVFYMEDDEFFKFMNEYLKEMVDNE